MRIHISRKHGGAEPFGTVYNRSRDSVSRATTLESQTYYHDKSEQIDQSMVKQNNTLRFLDEILEPMRKLKEFKELSTELNNSSSTGYTNIMQ
jgi:hypothetical protein